MQCYLYKAGVCGKKFDYKHLDVVVQKDFGKSWLENIVLRKSVFFSEMRNKDSSHSRKNDAEMAIIDWYKGKLYLQILREVKLEEIYH